MWLVYKEGHQRLERVREGERAWLEIVCIDVAMSNAIGKSKRCCSRLIVMVDIAFVADEHVGR